MQLNETLFLCYHFALHLIQGEQHLTAKTTITKTNITVLHSIVEFFKFNDRSNSLDNKQMQALTKI